MKTSTKALLVASAFAVTTVFTAPAFADKDNNRCDHWSRHGHGHHVGFGGGMWGGKNWRGDLNLSVENVKDILEGRLAWQGNDNLKVGEVKELDDKTVIAQIVTKEGSLVQKLEIDRNTGRPRSAK